MRLSCGLEQKLIQKQIMAPRMIQSMEILQLPMMALLEKIDQAQMEAAADLGARPLSSFLRITLPLSVPGIVAGSILVFIPAMGMFVVPD